MAKAIMVQGTMSNAGKSLLVCALCRIFKQDGYTCAPFKSQNMALNSYITEEGLEMGRAQVMQAAGIRPSVLMNPILLKPTSDMGSQVIVNGRAIGNQKAMDYFKHKKELIPDILKAYHTLEQQYDIIVIEGAGSPAEINLKENDIVNMGMAKMAKAPVLLVGDIDRGGVFAQLLGTLMLLEPDEKAIIKGLVINKFRGDKAILNTGLTMLEERGDKPVVGVIPYVHCDIEDEDSLSEKLEQTRQQGMIDIAVICLPHISNFTDFDVFCQYEGINVRYVTKAEQLKRPDMLILPGTKSTIEDLKWLRQSGLEAAIKKLTAQNIPLWGICGGYQMLGEEIVDREGVEAKPGETIQGMGLLKVKTVFEKEKYQKQVQGSFAKVSGIFKTLSEKDYTGYEIHMGESSQKEQPLTCAKEGNTEGSAISNIYGTYVHGIFDEKEVSQTMVQTLMNNKGYTMNDKEGMNRKQYKELQYDKLAQAVRQNLDMKAVYQILKEGI